jgi:hypothetical protein
MQEITSYLISAQKKENESRLEFHVFSIQRKNSHLNHIHINLFATFLLSTTYLSTQDYSAQLIVPHTFMNLILTHDIWNEAT